MTMTRIIKIATPINLRIMRALFLLNAPKASRSRSEEHRGCLSALLRMRRILGFVDHLFDLALRVAELLFGLASATIGLAFGFEVFVPGEASDGLFGVALYLLCLFAHRVPPSSAAPRSAANAL